jgi:hypothetical protein
MTQQAIGNQIVRPANHKSTPSASNECHGISTMERAGIPDGISASTVSRSINNIGGDE